MACGYLTPLGLLQPGLNLQDQSWDRVATRDGGHAGYDVDSIERNNRNGMCDYFCSGVHSV